MALTDKNIVITPNIGQANDPKIDFTGANAGTSGTITLTALPANGGTVSFAGAAGTLLTLANTITNTVVSVPSTLNSTSTTTGALTVAGGVGVGQDLRVGGSIYGTFAGTIPLPVTNNTTSATTQYLVFVSTSSGNVNLQVSAPTGITYQPSTGNFGLGVPNPGYRLDVFGGQKINFTTGGYLDLFYNGTISGNIVAGDGLLYLNTQVKNTVINANGGNVGIRQATPLFPLHVYADSKKQLTVSNGSGSTTRHAGINYRIDNVDLWQTYVNNASNNNFYIRYNDTTDVFTVDTTGNIGIGTSTTGVNITEPAPGRYLEIYAPGTTPALRLINDAATPAIYQLTAGIPNISTTGFSVWNEGSGLGVFNIDVNGKASINTQTVTNNNYFLDVWGSIGASIGSITIGQGGAFLSGSIFSNSTYGMIQRAKSTPSAAGATFAWVTQANAELMRLDPNGNWALGTTNAFEKWVLLGSANTATHAGLTYNMVVNSNNPLTPTNPSGVGGGIALGGIITGTTTATFAIISGVKENANFNDNAGAFIIGTRANGALVAEAMRVTSGKLVGIGTSTPLSQLHIKRTASGTALTLENSAGGTGSYVDLDFNTYSTTQGGYANAPATIRVIDDGAYSGHITFRKKGASIGAAQSEIVRFDSSGNVIVASGYLKTQGGHADISGTGSALNVLVPGGASYAQGGSSATGAIKIRLPQGYTDTMIRMTVKVYTYDGQSFDITCGGYNYGAGVSWLNTFAYLNTRNRGSLNVRFGHDGTYNCIFIGEIGTVWSYPQIFVTDFQAGYNNYAYTQWVNNWNISFFSASAFANTSAGQYVTSTVTAYPAWTTGSLVNVSQLTNDAGYLTAANTIAKYTIGNNGPQPCWIYLGRWNTAQQGYTLRMMITGMQGYNASSGQDQFTEIFFKTSNTSSSLTGSSGAFYANGQAYRTGGNTNGPQTVRVVQVDQSTYDFYTYWPGLTGQGSMYEVAVSVGTWVNSSTIVTPSGNYLDLTWYTNWTSQSLTNLSQLTNDVPFYKSGDSPTFGTVTANSYVWNGNGSAVGGTAMLNMTHDSQTLFSGSNVLGDGVNSDLLAFNMPTTAEYYNGTSWASTTVSTFYDAFRGKIAQRFGGTISLNSTTQQRIRFTWNSWGYKFWNGVIISGSAQGNNMWLTVETSADGSTWNTQINDVDIGGGWPNYNYVRNISNNSGSSPYLRITIRRNTTGANAANAVAIGNISIIGSYGGYANLFDWDYSRNVTFPGNVYAPVYYDASNSAYYVDPASGTVLNGNVVIGQTGISYTSMDNTSLISTVANNALHVNGSIQLTTDNSAYVVGRGTASFFRDEEIGFGWGGGWYMTDATYLRVRNDKVLYSGGSAQMSAYYDVNDTSYYLDMNNAGSLLRGRLNVTGGHGGSSLRVYLAPGENGAATGLVTLQQWCSEPGNTWDGAGFGYNVDNNLNEGGNVPAYHFGRPNTNFGQAYMRMTTDGNWYFYNTPSGSNTRYTTMRLDRTGYAVAEQSFRAPIFYDYDNTGYYVDPNSTSNLYGLIVGGRDNGTAIFYRSSNPYTLGGTDAVVTISDRSGSDWGLIIDKTGFDYGLQINGTGTYGAITVSTTKDSTRLFNVDFNGMAYSVASMRAPIFYDLDNTGYYVDPAGTTNINNLTVNGSFNIGSINPLINGPWYTYYLGNLTASGTQALRYEVARIYQDTVNWKLSGTLKIELHNYYYTGNDFQVWMIGYHGTTPQAHMVQGHSTFGRWAQVTLGSPVQYSGNVYYLPIYVDVRYYGYYHAYISTDWNRITTTSPGGTGPGYGALYIFPTPSGTAISDFSPNTTLYTNDIITTGASVRAPVFYDLDNTGYYIDPNSSTSANFAGSVNVATYNYAGLRLNASGSGSAGAAFAIQQVTAEGWTGIFVDYEPYTGWGLYHDNPNNYFLITAESTGGQIGSNTVPSRVSGNRTAYTKFLFDQNSAHGYAGGSWRSPIFYDYDNTGYYANPAGQSFFYQLNTENNGGTAIFIGNGSVSTSNRLTINFHTDGDLNYYIGKPAGGWVQPLNIHFYTGIRHYSHHAYDYGSSFWNIATGAVVASFNQGDNHTRIFYNLYAPIFYDRDNTNYYIDPAGTSVMGGINIGGYAVTTTQYQPVTSNRDFGSGTLVQTNIVHADYGDPWVIEITGNSYGGGLSWNIQGQGYLYSATNINVSFTSNGQPINGLQIIRYNGNLCFWWPRQGYWQGFNVKVYVPYATYPVNRVTSITDSGLPGGYDRALTPTIYQSYNQYNQANYDVTFNRVYANTDMRTYIYYDWANTGYYVDPNGTSNLAALTTNSSLNFYMGSGNRVRVYDTDSGLFTYNAEGTGVTVRVGAAWGRPGSYSGGNYTVGSEGIIDFWISGGQKGYIDSSNNLFMYGSMRAPIFYDRDNTGYYSDQASTSNYNVLNIQYGGVAGSLYFNGAYGNTYNSDPMWIAGRYISGNVTALDIYIGDDGRNSPLSSPVNGWGGQDGSIDYLLIRTTNQGIHHIFGSDGDYTAARTIYAPSESVRAPIFYDYNNTGYYVDPNSTSNLYYVVSAYGQSYQNNGYNNAGGFAMNNASTYWGLMINYSPNDWRLGWGATTAAYGWTLRWDNGGTTWSNYSHRAPVFYDADNTGYYIDANNTSNLYALTVATRISGGITYARYLDPYITSASDGNPITGTTGNRSVPYYGMYTYHTYGNTNITPVYFGAGFGWGNGPGGSAEIIANWVSGGSPSGIYWRSLRDCCTNWTGWARFLTTYDDPYPSNMNQYVRTTDSPTFSTLYSQVYYDSNNSGYYADPASTSNFYAANFQNRSYHYNYVYIGNAGGIMGDYNSAGTAEKVIWTIGESWPLGNMYGLGYQYSSSPYISTGHTIVVKENGGTYTRLHMNGGIWTSGPFSSATWPYFGGMYDYNDTGYYVDPNGYTSLQYVTSRTKDRLGLTAKWNTPRSDYTGDSNYWTGSMGWGGNDANTITGWGNGYFDSWGVGTGNNFPPSTSHFVGQQAFHYTYGGGGYGWQMVNGGGSTSVWFRPMWYGPQSWQNFVFYGINNYSNDLYSTRMYDSNDTGYYCDPNSTSQFYRIDVNDYLYARNGCGRIYLPGNLHIDSFCGNQIYLNYYSNNPIRFYGTAYHNGYDSYGINRNDFNYGYDGNDTSYYIDLNSTTRCVRINVNYIEAYNTNSAAFYSNGQYYTYNSAGYGMYVYSQSNYSAQFAFHKGGYYAVNMGLDADNVIRIGGWSAAANRWQLDMSGNMYTAGNITAYSSDRRLKKNIKTIENPVEMLTQLRGVYFDWEDFVDELGFNPIDRHDIGVIAQEVQAVIPMAIKPAPFDTGGEGKSESGQNYLTVQIEKIIPVLIEAVKTQQAEINALKNQLLELQSK